MQRPPRFSGAAAVGAPAAASTSEGPPGAGDTAAVVVPGKGNAPVKRFVRGAIPLELLQDPELAEDLRVLPRAYNFEMHKVIHQVRSTRASCVGLQFPEGLLLFALAVADILEKHTGAGTLILGDVCYGACCVGDAQARAHGCDMLVHFGHSCLVPQSRASLNVLYVFVEVKIHVGHMVESVAACMDDGTDGSRDVVLAGTVQFVSAVHQARALLEARGFRVTGPQAKPLSPGEVLGCTSPRLDAKAHTLVFVADGRFHMEAVMIRNPWLKRCVKYDPYNRVLTRESYDYDGLLASRASAIQRAQAAQKWVVVQGSLGRQGNPDVVDRCADWLGRAGKRVEVRVLREITPDTLRSWTDVEAVCEVACPRLALDWGDNFDLPIVTPYELSVVLGKNELVGGAEAGYPMDYYEASAGEWGGAYRPRPAGDTPETKVAAEATT